MKQLVLILSVLLLPVTSGAASYSWTDPAGTMHFTDDLGSVPQKYRAKALRQAASEPATAPAPSSPQQPAPAASTAKPEPPATAAANGVAGPETRFGDRTAVQWQAEFRGFRAKLKQIEQQQEQLRKDGGDGKKLLSRQQIDKINTRNKQLYEEYETTRLQFNQLVEQANKVGLPPEYGQ
ncbi:MAG: hypothetical protein PHN92_13930 [Geobacter sp.]|nr:hypothetical protein [Geobacter sp.]